MIDTASKARRLDHWVQLREEFHSDLAWWKMFLEGWNGTGLFTQNSWNPGIVFTLDTSGSWGCGASWQEQWLQCRWAGAQKNGPYCQPLTHTYPSNTVAAIGHSETRLEITRLEAIAEELIAGSLADSSK